MSLIIDSTKAVFDLTKIKKGDLIYAKHSTWPTGKNGIVTAVKEDQITVKFHPAIGNIENHFYISVADAEAEKWTIRWSHDLTSVESFPEEEQDEP